jgi:hypothetical protein
MFSTRSMTRSRFNTLSYFVICIESVPISSSVYCIICHFFMSISFLAASSCHTCYHPQARGTPFYTVSIVSHLVSDLVLQFLVLSKVFTRGLFSRPEDGDRMFLGNTGRKICQITHPRTQHSSN